MTIFSKAELHSPLIKGLDDLKKPLLEAKAIGDVNRVVIIQKKALAILKAWSHRNTENNTPLKNKLDQFYLSHFVKATQSLLATDAAKKIQEFKEFRQRVSAYTPEELNQHHDEIIGRFTKYSHYIAKQISHFYELNPQDNKIDENDKSGSPKFNPQESNTKKSVEALRLWRDQVDLAQRQVAQRLFEINKPNSSTDKPAASPQANKVKFAQFKNTKNNCWLNSVIQFLMHIPSVMQSISKEKPQAIDNFFNQYHLAQQNHTKTDTQPLRQHLAKQGLCTVSGNQEDPVDVLSWILGSVKKMYTFQQFIDKMPSSDRSESVIQLTKEKTFHEMMEKFFCSTDDQNRVIKLHFDETPQDLIVQIKRFKHEKKNNEWHREKITDAINIPEYYQLTPEKSGNKQEALYELDACIIHVGDSLEKGHFVGLVKDSTTNTWYLLDDDKPAKKLRTSEALRYINTGYLFHFKKIDETA